MPRAEPATTWPDRPLFEWEARSLYESDDDAQAVWVIYHDESVRSRLVPLGTPDDAVVDVVLEADELFRVYSYSGDRWLDYGTYHKEEAETISTDDTLDSYRVLAGYSDVL